MDLNLKLNELTCDEECNSLYFSNSLCRPLLLCSPVGANTGQAGSVMPGVGHTFPDWSVFSLILESLSVRFGTDKVRTTQTRLVSFIDWSVNFSISIFSDITGFEMGQLKTSVSYPGCSSWSSHCLSSKLNYHCLFHNEKPKALAQKSLCRLICTDWFGSILSEHLSTSASSWASLNNSCKKCLGNKVLEEWNSECLVIHNLRFRGSWRGHVFLSHRCIKKLFNFICCVVISLVIK